MIRTLISLIFVAGLTACASTGQESASPAATSSASSGSESTSSFGSSTASCDAQPVQRLVGQTYSTSLDGDLRSGATVNQLRVLRPGQVMTLEYNPSRLNVILEKDDIISALRCG